VPRNALQGLNCPLVLQFPQRAHEAVLVAAGFLPFPRNVLEGNEPKRGRSVAAGRPIRPGSPIRAGRSVRTGPRAVLRSAEADAPCTTGPAQLSRGAGGTASTAVGTERRLRPTLREQDQNLAAVAAWRAVLSGMSRLRRWPSLLWRPASPVASSLVTSPAKAGRRGAVRKEWR
jgi:hypothetical protein